MISKCGMWLVYYIGSKSGFGFDLVYVTLLFL